VKKLELEMEESFSWRKALAATLAAIVLVAFTARMIDLHDHNGKFSIYGFNYWSCVQNNNPQLGCL
jgi:hypothetical protein